MKLTKQNLNDLVTLMHHTRMDISYNGGGTYNLGDEDNTFDKMAATQSLRAIDLIHKIIEHLNKK